MSDSQKSSDPSPESNQPPKRNQNGNSKRPERGQPNKNLLWYVVVVAVLVILAFTITTSNQRKGEKLGISQFVNGLNSEKYGPHNVHELLIRPGYIQFQDQPKPKPGEASKTAETTRQFYIPAHGITDDEKSELTKLLTAKGIDYSYPEPTPEWHSVAYLLMIPVLIFVFFLILFRKMGGAGSAMSFGRSRGKLQAQEDLEITFHDVAGIEEAVEELREVVEFLRSPGKYQALGGRIPRGVLLVGPPGTGKTLLAKAVAGEAGVPFFSLSGSDFVEMFVGVGAARVRDMFHQAAQRSPAIIFIDELDALGKTRGSGMPGGHDEREQTLNALLVEMDGFSSDQSVIVMGATNRPETLDPALLRPGRFDRNVLVDRPDIGGREAILKVHVTKIKMDDSVDLKRIAKLTPGFVGADLANLVNEAALLAARKNKSCVTKDEFEEGIERVVAGLEKQTRIIHEEEKQRVAYHECGHALVACCLPNTDPVHKISIIPRGLGALGYTLQRPEDDRQLATQTELQNRICVLLGGIAAEEIVFQETSTGAQNDLQRATDLARRMVTEFGMSPTLGRVNYANAQRSPFLGTAATPTDYAHSEETVREIDLEVKRIIDEASTTAYEILMTRKEVMEHMARELLEREVMDAEQLKRILDQYKTGPQIKPGTYAATTGSTAAGSALPDDDDEELSDDPPLRRDSLDGA